MKYIFVPLLGARKNPELNVRIPVAQQLTEFIQSIGGKVKNYYVTFTELPKVGINPVNRFGTPLGIYTYPMSLLSDGTLHDIPFAEDRQYINILQSTVTDDNKILSAKTYSSSKFERDYAKLQAEFNRRKAANSNGRFLTEENVSRADRLIHKYIGNSYSLLKRGAKADDIQFEDLYRIAKIILNHFTAEQGWPKKRLLYLWFLTETFSFLLAPNSGADSKYDAKSPKTNANTVKWNWLLRNVLGYHLILDNGIGFIHPNEPTQALFLSKHACKLVKTIINDDPHNNKQTRKMIVDSNRPSYLQKFYLLTEKQYAQYEKINPDIKLLRSKAINTQDLFSLKLVDGKLAITRGSIRFKKPNSIVYHDFIIHINCRNANFERCQFVRQQIVSGMSIPSLDFCNLKSCVVNGYAVSESQVRDSKIVYASVNNTFFGHCVIENGMYRTIEGTSDFTRKTVFRDCDIRSGVYEKTVFLKSKIASVAATGLSFVECYFKDCTFESDADIERIRQNNTVIYS